MSEAWAIDGIVEMPRVDHQRASALVAVVCLYQNSAKTIVETKATVLFAVVGAEFQRGILSKFD